MPAFVKHPASLALMVAAIVFAASLVGCESHPQQPPEVGWHVDAITTPQIAKARADERVIYCYEWRDAAGTTLSDYGRRHLAAIDAASGSARPVVLEPSGDPAVDAARRSAVVASLRPDETVVVARPAAYGTPGEEAGNVDADTPRGGQTNGSSGGSGGTSPGGGLGVSGGAASGTRSGGF